MIREQRGTEIPVIRVVREQRGTDTGTSDKSDKRTTRYRHCVCTTLLSDHSLLSLVALGDTKATWYRVSGKRATRYRDTSDKSGKSDEMSDTLSE